MIPWFTRGWQNYQQELEIKKELVGDISEAVMRMVMKVQSFEIGLTHSQQSGRLQLSEEMQRFNNLINELNTDYREWEISSAVIGSQLRAYYRDSEIGPRWDLFSQNVTRFYADIQMDYSNALKGMNHDTWLREREILLEEKDNLIRTILNKPISGF